MIRPATEHDLPALTELYNYYILNSYATFELIPHTIGQRRLWLESFAPPYYLLVLERDGDILGYAYNSKFNERAAYATSVTTSVYIKFGLTGQGVGTQLYTALFEKLSHNHPELHRAYAGIAQPNTASVALHKKFGFVEVAQYHEAGRKFDKYWDVYWYERPLP